MDNNQQTEILAMNVYSVLIGYDYMTGSSLKTVEEFSPNKFDEAREYIAKHPELKEIVGYFQREKTKCTKRMQDQRDSARAQRNELRNRYNELCEKTGTDDFIEEFYF